ncbi:diguanylate cyclase (GGDEF)-like protein/PAS domain S-box-containing protein [Saccharopolyspora lacisalsi]|uniref:Diguanylate cyclase (GGDEF)-like protein/PAS domain S-box-containing protein n=1 Tax=Halosaccharopolyspora lacisalsi TaxID=1000566 RepID=A0A839DZV5_9PSEU|nr:diguanylate cyclase [Halosaccharopolyspora lacisalsi]MBA8825786.1 diguanylate cyclase (GGDEF)-like protein/PAS domain S-box-containing protein [Halosaccharopolyspora lacisalsi]
MTQQQEKDEFVRQWAREVLGSSYVSKTRPQVWELLDACTTKLVSALMAEEYSPVLAAEVGARLIREHFVGSRALRGTLQLVATGLPGVAGFTCEEVPRERLLALLGALAGGYSRELRERTLGEQEVIRQAVLQAKDEAEEAHRATEARFRAVFASSALGIAIVSLDGTIEDVNESVARIFRTTRESMVDSTILDLVDEGWWHELAEANAELVAECNEHFEVDTRYTVPDSDEEVWTQVTGSLVYDAHGRPEYQVVLYTDITDRNLLKERLSWQAMHDPLTGLANRTLLQSRTESALDQSTPGHRIGLCYLDLDGFKTINDTLGHRVGDELLRAVAQRLHEVVDAEGALAARMGGDEFVVLVPDSGGTRAVLDLVSRFYDAITRPVHVGEHELSASASVGVVERETVGTDLYELQRDADISLYRAKSDGKAQWALFDSEQNAFARQRFRLSAEMPAALDNDEFFVEYHPITWLADGSLAAVHAEVIWDHEDRDIDSAEFLEIAEETGVIIRLGTWMMRQVCEHAMEWVRSLGSAAPIVSVDLSPRYFRAPGLVDEVGRILEETGAPARNLRLSVPESALFDECGDPVDTLSVFVEMGFDFVVRDFGSDYTHLGRLSELPVSTVCVEGDYLNGLAGHRAPEPLSEHLVHSVVSAAHLLGMTVIAAGVRTEEHAARLHKVGVQAVRGEYAGERASALEIRELIDSGEFVGSR